MTDERLDEIRHQVETIDRIYPGEWRVICIPGTKYTLWDVDYPRDDDTPSGRFSILEDPPQCVAEFIAGSKRSTADLLTEVDRLRAENAHQRVIIASLQPDGGKWPTYGSGSLAGVPGLSFHNLPLREASWQNHPNPYPEMAARLDELGWRTEYRDLPDGYTQVNWISPEGERYSFVTSNPSDRHYLFENPELEAVAKALLPVEDQPESEAASEFCCERDRQGRHEWYICRDGGRVCPQCGKYEPVMQTSRPRPDCDCGEGWAGGNCRSYCASRK